MQNRGQNQNGANNLNFDGGFIKRVMKLKEPKIKITKKCSFFSRPC